MDQNDMTIETKLQEIQRAITLLQTQLSVLNIKMEQQQRSRTHCQSDFEEEAIEDVHCLFQFIRRITCFRF